MGNKLTISITDRERDLIQLGLTLLANKVMNIADAKSANEKFKEIHGLQHTIMFAVHDWIK